MKISVPGFIFAQYKSIIIIIIIIIIIVLIFFKFVHPYLRLFCCVINNFFKYNVYSDSFYNTNSYWLWRWLLHRLSKRKSLSTTTVLFSTTFTRTIIINLLMIVFVLPNFDIGLTVIILINPLIKQPIGLFIIIKKIVTSLIVNRMTNWLQQPYN